MVLVRRGGRLANKVVVRDSIEAISPLDGPVVCESQGREQAKRPII